MAWSYDESLAADKDRVRWLIGDTQDSDPLVQDEEIDFALFANSNVYGAAAIACRAVAARLARELTLVGSAGSIALDAQEQSKRFLAMAVEYETRASSSGLTAGVYAGGISINDKRSQETSADRVRPGFTVNLHRSQLVPPSPRETEFT